MSRPWWLVGQSGLASGVLLVAQLALGGVFVSMILRGDAGWWTYPALVLALACVVACVASIVYFARHLDASDPLDSASIAQANDPNRR